MQFFGGICWQILGDFCPIFLTQLSFWKISLLWLFFYDYYTFQCCFSSASFLYLWSCYFMGSVIILTFPRFWIQLNRLMFSAKSYVPSNIKTQMNLLLLLGRLAENFCNFVKVSYFLTDFFRIFIAKTNIKKNKWVNCVK